MLQFINKKDTKLRVTPGRYRQIHFANKLKAFAKKIVVAER